MLDSMNFHYLYKHVQKQQVLFDLQLIQEIHFKIGERLQQQLSCDHEQAVTQRQMLFVQ